VGNPEKKKRLPISPGRRWEERINKDIKEIILEAVRRFLVAQGID